MILLHIIGGLVGLTSGAVALSAGKRSKLHRESGMVFVYAMLVLSTSGAVMAALKPEQISVIAGMLTIYLVITAWHTVRRHSQEFSWMDADAQPPVESAHRSSLVANVLCAVDRHRFLLSWAIG